MGIRDSAPAYIALQAIFCNASWDAGSVSMGDLDGQDDWNEVTDE